MTKLFDEAKQIALAGRDIVLWYEKCDKDIFDMSRTKYVIHCTSDWYSLYCSTNRSVITDTLVKKAIRKDVSGFARPDLKKIFIVMFYEDAGEFFVYQERDPTYYIIVP